MTSRLGRTEIADDGAGRSSRIGLSDYTTQRLAELRARRAELESDYKDYKSTSKSSTDTSGNIKLSPTSPISSGGKTDLSANSTSRSAVSSNGTISPPRTQPTSAPNAITTNGTSSISKLSPTRPGTSSSVLDSTDNSVSRKSSSLTKGVGLSSAASFSAADYSSSRSGQLSQHKASINLNRSNSARIPAPNEFDDEDCVGFSSLPEQVHRRAVKHGFDFTLMVVGETGLGKSTLISSLFLSPDLYKDREQPVVQDCLSRTVEIEKKYMEIEEKGIKLRLTIVDTPGFNDSMDAEQSWRPIEQYISSQFDQYFKDETGLNRKNIKDHRVHCCLYFVSPYGHGLRQIDVQFMKRLHDKVNIVPIIAKADTLTPIEVHKLKQKVMDQIDEHDIHIYEFPDCDSDEDEDFKSQDAELKSAIPFAVIGSNTVVEVGGQKVRGRLYPWGIVEVDNPQHCDFSKLRMMLINTHMQDLKDVTSDIHYENFRAQHIKDQMTSNQRERNKLKRDSSPNFESIIDQNQLLQEKDEEIRRMQLMMSQLQKELQNSKKTALS